MSPHLRLLKLAIDKFFDSPEERRLDDVDRRMVAYLREMKPPVCLSFFLDMVDCPTAYTYADDDGDVVELDSETLNDISDKLSAAAALMEASK